jgi:hypothetical protein
MNLKLDACVRSLPGLNLGTLIGSRISPTRGTRLNYAVRPFSLVVIATDHSITPYQVAPSWL